ncbi:hypothetical protein BJ875DRAFT_366152 [Amylocarpus encephaloides]|uniref:Uncharacterized protein n=1 Tax=Amylocarpus encephaloides TaxID=45428 RepID=A0A9P7YTR9_9HELO|nr:hypothetical protein BJ875DRAFT_366152 [Amylocarpus encephaloides]
MTLQGTIVLYFYDEVTYDGSPSYSRLVRNPGERIFDLITRPEVDDFILESKLEEAYKSLFNYRVLHGDGVLYNIFEVGPSVMFNDFEIGGFRETRIWERAFIGLT